MIWLLYQKRGQGLIDSNGNDIGGQYFARFNDVDRVDNPEVSHQILLELGTTTPTAMSILL